MPSIGDQLGAGDGGGGRAPAADVDHLVGVAVDDERGDAEAAQPRGAVALREDGEHLAHHAAGADAAVEGLAGAGAQGLGGGGVGGGADQRPHGDAALDVGVPPGLARPDQPRQEGRVLPADRASSGRRADAGQRAHPRRVLDGDRLRDHAAHRHADEVGGLQAEVVEQRDGVAGQVGHRVRRPRTTGREGAHELVAPDRRRDPRRPAGVAVVVAHDVEARARELLAERLVPPRHRAAQAHHEEQRLVVGVAEGLVAELDLVADRGAELVGRDGAAGSCLERARTWRQ